MHIPISKNYKIPLIVNNTEITYFLFFNNLYKLFYFLFEENVIFYNYI